MKRLRLVAAGGVMVAAFVVSSHPSRAQTDLPLAKAETVGMSSKRLERINAFIKGYIDRREIAGAVTLVARKGKVVHFEAQGFRSKEENAPMQKDTIFSLMSMTKPIVSTALMMLWEDGRFMLDDPISKWLPSYANKQVVDQVTAQRVPARPVTVRHILTHTSGLSLTPTAGPNPLTDTPAEGARRLAGVDGARRLQPSEGEAVVQPPAQTRERPKTVAEAIERAAGSPLAFQPGDRWQYGSSTDFVAVLVEKMSGMTIDEFVRTKVFEPLGMRDTHYNIPRDKMSRVAAVYRPDADGHITLLRKPEFREPTTYFPGVAGAERHGGRLLPVLPDAPERRRVRRAAPARPDDGRHDDHEPDRGGQAGLHPRRRLRVRPRLRRAHEPGEITRCAVDRHLHMGRRRRYAVLDRSAGGFDRDPDGAAEPVHAERDPSAVLGGRVAGDHRQPGRTEAPDYGAPDAAVEI